MRKIAIIIFLCIYSLCISTSTYAACSVDSTPSPKMKIYIENLLTVLQKINAGAIAAKACTASTVSGGASDGVDSAMESILVANNDVWNWGGFVDSFRMYGEALVDTERPKPVEREMQMLETLRSKIYISYQTIWKNCVNGVTIPDGMTSIPQLDGQTYISAMDILLQNHILLEGMYRRAVLEDSAIGTQVLLVDTTGTDIETDIRTAYSRAAMTTCRGTTGTSESISDSLEKIWKEWAKADTSRKSWDEAMALLKDGKDNAKYRNMENDLLKAELQRQGIWKTGVDRMLANLATYDKTEWSDGNILARMANTVANVSTEGSKIFDVFRKVADTSDSVPLLLERSQNIAYMDQEIWTDIVGTYRAELLRIGASTDTDAKTVKDLLDLHIKLQTVNEKMDEKIQKIRNICKNKVLPGYGNCGPY